MTTTWIAVANRSAAHLFETASKIKAPKHLFSIPNKEGRLLNQEIESDDGGRVKHESQHGQNKYQPPKEATEVVAERFAREVAAHLEKALHEKRFDKLVVVAEPSFLGELRGTMSKQLSKVLTQTIDKDYAAGKTPEIAERLKEEVSISLI